MLQASSTSSLTHKLASLGLGSKEKEHKRTFSLPGRSGAKEKAKEAGKARGDRASRDTINHTESGEQMGRVSVLRDSKDLMFQRTLAWAGWAVPVCVTRQYWSLLSQRK